MKRLVFPEDALIKVEDGPRGKRYLFAIPRAICDETFFFLTDVETQFVSVPEERILEVKGGYAALWGSGEPVHIWEPAMLRNIHRETVYAPSHEVRRPRRLYLKKASRDDFFVSAAVAVKESKRCDGESVSVSKTDMFPIKKGCRGMFVCPHIGAQGDFAVLYDTMIRSEDENTVTYTFPQGAVLKTYRFDKGLVAESGTFPASAIDGVHMTEKEAGENENI